MSSLEQFSDAWLNWAWAVSWQFTLLAAIVAIACRLLRSASPRLRHALWLLLLAKVLLPPSLAAPWGVANWAVPINVDALPQVGITPSDATEDVIDAGGAATRQNPEPAHSQSFSTSQLLMTVWAVVALTFWGIVIWRYRRLSRQVDAMPSIDEGPLRIGLERLSQQWKVNQVPQVHVNQATASPYLIGLLRPRIVLPQSLLDELSADDVQTVLLHELIHWKRRDTWIGCGQILSQGLLWFHPLVWWAGIQLRNERENVCDDAVVRFGSIEPRQYGEVILRVLTASRARSRVTGSLVGVFERGAKLQQRLEDVMSYDSTQRTFGWRACLFLCGFTLLFLPMGRSQKHQATASPPASTAGNSSKTSGEKPAATNSDQQQTPYPVIVATSPKSGSTGIAISLSEITVTFDRDMGDGMSWTGGPPLFPPTDNTRMAEWTDKRTCVLPVKLKRGQFYRVGINAKSYQNFRSTDGVPVPPTAIFFVTEGATKAVERRVQVPEVVELDPANDSSRVDPATSTLRVTFNMPMDEGFSWTGGGEQFPETPGKPYWSKDGKTCTLPVKLKPNHTYQLGLNSLSHNNFQSKWGVPLKPVVYKFQTEVDPGK